MKRIVKKILQVTGWVVLGTFLVISLAFSSREVNDIECREITVKYAGTSPIRLGSRELIRMVRSTDPHIIGKSLSDIDTEAIEAEVGKHKTVLKADAYKTVVRDSTGLKGVVTLKVRHRIPEIRILSSQGNYYMDKSGNKIPASVGYAADVPVATGNISQEYAREELLPLVEFIQDDKFWRAQIRQIHVNGGGDILFTTLVGDQLIEFGPAENMEEKFRNLRAFYDQVLTNNNWNRYDRIIVKFKNQVIAKKNK